MVAIWQGHRLQVATITIFDATRASRRPSGTRVNTYMACGKGIGPPLLLVVAQRLLL